VARNQDDLGLIHLYQETQTGVPNTFISDPFPLYRPAFLLGELGGEMWRTNPMRQTQSLEFKESLG